MRLRILFNCWFFKCPRLAAIGSCGENACSKHFLVLFEDLDLSTRISTLTAFSLSYQASNHALFPRLISSDPFPSLDQCRSAAYLETHSMIFLKIESFVMYLYSHYSSASIKKGDWEYLVMILGHLWPKKCGRSSPWPKENVVFFLLLA